MTYTRRDITKLALGSALLATVPVVLRADEGWAERLEHRLNAMIEEGAFKVTPLTQSGTATHATLTLTWPPGTRRRRVEADGGYDALEAEALASFADVLPSQID